MIGKLIGFIAGIVVLAFFAGFNLDNKCDVNILFHTFKDVPVMFTIVFSFVIGILVAIPICYLGRAQKRDKEDVQKAAEQKVLKRQQAEEVKAQKEQEKQAKLLEKQAKEEEKERIKQEKLAKKQSKENKESKDTSDEKTVEVTL